MTLTLTPNIADPDGFYDALLKTHDGLTSNESQALNARLVLILCNHIGNRQVIDAALQAAKKP